MIQKNVSKKWPAFIGDDKATKGSSRSQKSKSLAKWETSGTIQRHATQNPVKVAQVRVVLAWDIDIHTPQTANQGQGNKDGGQKCQSVHDIVGHVVGLSQLQVDLSEVVCVCSVQDTVIVVDVLHHGYNVIYTQYRSNQIMTITNTTARLPWMSPK